VKGGSWGRRAKPSWGWPRQIVVSRFIVSPFDPQSRRTRQTSLDGFIAALMKSAKSRSIAVAVILLVGIRR
jgi:hypothetical protein